MTQRPEFIAGRDLLGPIFLQYLHQLDAHIRHFSQEHRAKVLFASRAGLRLQALYQRFLQQRGLTPPEGLAPLWISRFMAAKAAWTTRHELTWATLAPEFAHGKLTDVVTALYQGEPLPPGYDERDPVLRRNAARFNEFIWSAHPVASDLRWRLTQQSDWFKRYWQQLTDGASTVVIVDSGWQGSIQRLLADIFPEQTFWGLYIGRCGGEHTDRRYWHHTIGLAFEADQFDPAQPASAINLHRHLIESLLEPAAKSIERIGLDDSGEPFFPESLPLLDDQPTLDDSAVFLGICEHIQQHAASLNLAQVTRQGQAAARELALKLAYPSPADADVLGDMHRSADFGRSLHVPVLLDPVDREPDDSAERRITESLWPAGQAALEYGDEIRAHRQKLEVPGGYTPAALVARLAPQAASPRPLAGTVPRVAVITRTMDRPVFLRRALRSVAGQQFKDYVHVVVCDGGDIEQVRRTIADAPVDHTRILLVDNVVNRGMEAASNIGIRASQSDYIVIHDDDDSWEPAFLQQTVAFLDAKSGAKYGGVISHCHYISEEVLRDSIVERARRPYQDWVRHVHLTEMATGNFFAPIAFLFRRSVYQELGGYDESLPVLGDWDFNLRFLMRADIGVLPEKLALYHHRDVGNKKLFGNSVIDGIDKHTEYASIMRNKLIRQGGELGAQLAQAMVTGHVHAEHRHLGGARHAEVMHKLNALTAASAADGDLQRLNAELEDRWNTIAYLMNELERTQAELAAAQSTQESQA